MLLPWSVKRPPWADVPRLRQPPADGIPIPVTGAWHMLPAAALVELGVPAVFRVDQNRERRMTNLTYHNQEGGGSVKVRRPWSAEETAEVRDDVELLFREAGVAPPNDYDVMVDDWWILPPPSADTRNPLAVVERLWGMVDQAMAHEDRREGYLAQRDGLRKLYVDGAGNSPSAAT